MNSREVQGFVKNNNVVLKTIEPSERVQNVCPNPNGLTYGIKME